MTPDHLLGPLIFAVASLLLLLAFGILYYSRIPRFREKVIAHFYEVLPHGSTVTGTFPGRHYSLWQQWRARASIYAGFELRPRHLIIIPAVFAGFGLAGWMMFGLAGALIMSGAAVLIFGFALPYGRLRRRQALIIAQMPMFIDQLLRSLSTGRSMESAMRYATEEAPEPLRQILERVMRATDLGADMADSMTEAAALHGLKELRLVGLAMRISSAYGSSPKDMLESVVQMVRQQELARRELAAMTGETRITAWVLGLTPVTIAIYIIVVNPGYINILLQDPSGKLVLIMALGFQVAGALMLWRMLRSV